MQEGEQRLQLAGIFKGLLRRKGHYPEEVSFAGWRRPKAGIAPGGRVEEGRYLSDAGIKRNSQLSLIKFFLSHQREMGPMAVTEGK